MPNAAFDDQGALTPLANSTASAFVLRTSLLDTTAQNVAASRDDERAIEL